MPEQLSVLERIQLKQCIDQELDGLYQRASELGQLMGTYFGTTSRSQLRNLEAVVGAATRTSALKNHIKNQTGKDRDKSWSLKIDGVSLGDKALAFIESLGGRAAVVVEKAELTDDPVRDQNKITRMIEIELQRGVVQTAVCAALYADVGKTP